MRDEAPRIDLIPAAALEREARAFERGERRFGHKSWLRLADCRTDCLNHALRHLLRWAEGDRSEDHLAHARANLAIILDLEARAQLAPNAPARARAWEPTIVLGADYTPPPRGKRPARRRT